MKKGLIVCSIVLLLILTACSDEPKEKSREDMSPIEQIRADKAQAEEDARLRDEAQERGLKLRFHCDITAQTLRDYCPIDVLPEEQEDCTFVIRGDNLGRKGGRFFYERRTATLDDYNNAWQAVPGTSITNELKPNYARNEVHPYKYIWWFTGEDLITFRVTKELCKYDQMKALLKDVMYSSS